MKQAILFVLILVIPGLSLYSIEELSKSDKKMYKSALKKYNKGELDAAFVISDELAKSNPRNIDVNFLLAEILDKNKEEYQAKISYEISKNLIKIKLDEQGPELSGKETRQLSDDFQYCATRINVLSGKTQIVAEVSETTLDPVPEDPIPQPYVPKKAVVVATAPVAYKSVLTPQEIQFASDEFLLSGNDQAKISRIQGIVNREFEKRAKNGRWILESSDKFGALNDSWDTIMNSRTIFYINQFNDAQNELLQANIGQQENILKQNTFLGEVKSLEAQRSNLEQSLDNHDITVTNYTSLIKSYAVGLDNKKRAVPKSIILVCKIPIGSETELRLDDFDRMQNHAEQAAIEKLNGYSWQNLSIEQTINSDTDLNHYFSQTVGGMAQAKIFDEVTIRSDEPGIKDRYVAYHINVKESSETAGKEVVGEQHDLDLYEYRTRNGVEQFVSFKDGSILNPNTIYEQIPGSLKTIQNKYQHSLNINAKYEESIVDFCNEFLDQKENLVGKRDAHSSEKSLIDTELLETNIIIDSLNNEILELDTLIAESEAITKEKWSDFDSLYHFLDYTYALERYIALPGDAVNKGDKVHLNEIVFSSYHECISSNSQKRKSQTFVLNNNILGTKSEEDIFEPIINRCQIISMGLTTNPASSSSSQPVITLNLGFEIAWEKEDAMGEPELIPKTELGNPIFLEDAHFNNDGQRLYLLSSLSSAREFETDFGEDYQLIPLDELNMLFASLGDGKGEFGLGILGALEATSPLFVSSDFEEDLFGDRTYKGLQFEINQDASIPVEKISETTTVYIIYKER